MFEEFSLDFIETSGARIAVRQAGRGPALLLLHGFPQTSAAWHLLAPRLAPYFRVVLADLRGCGDSIAKSAPKEADRYSFRAMACDQAEVMAALGHDRFFLAGHDRGARTAWRLARTRPELVQRLALIDILPTGHVWKHMDLPWAMTAWHWLFLAQPGGLPQRMFSAMPPAELMGALLRDPAIGPSAHTPGAFAEYVRCCSPKSIEAWCGDYRSAAMTGVVEDAIDLRERYNGSVYLAWAEGSHVSRGRSPVEVWRDYCADVRGQAFRSSHYIPEEQPELLAEALRAFFLD